MLKAKTFHYIRSLSKYNLKKKKGLAMAYLILSYQEKPKAQLEIRFGRYLRKDLRD